MQLGANPKSKGKGNESKGKGKDIKGKDKAKDVRNESFQESEMRRSEKVFLLQQNRPREGRVLQATERSCRGRKETGGSIATSTRRNSDRAVAVLTPRRETHVNVCHSHAFCEQRNVFAEFSSEQTVRSPGAGSFTPAETQRVRPIASIPVK